MDVYFVSLFAHNLPIALIIFAALIFSRRKTLSITALRAAYVFLIGWLGGSILVFLMHLILGMAGTQVGDDPLDGLLAIIGILPIMYPSQTLFSQTKSSFCAT